MWVKICGTTNLPDALLAVEHGADALGLIFAPSKRRITAVQASAITSHLPPGVQSVGVFTTADALEIIATVAEAGLTAVQLHLPHDPDFTAELSRRLEPGVLLIQVVGMVVPEQQASGAETQGSPIRASPASPGKSKAVQTAATVNEARLRAAFADPNLWAVLLDAEKGGHSGGLGLAFSWKAIQPVLSEVLKTRTSSRSGEEGVQAPATPRLLLAGGLHAENVQEAIGTLRPWGVDCVSGVEGQPGHKDPTRLSAFLHAIRTAK